MTQKVKRWWYSPLLHEFKLWLYDPLPLISEWFTYMTGEGSSSGNPGNPGSGGDPENSVNPGNNNNNNHNNNHLNTNSSLTRDESSNTVNSGVSYNSDDLKEAVAPEVVNASNIMDNPNFTSKEKKEEIMKTIARMSNELIETKRQLKIAKQNGTMQLKLDLE